jgi:hypothetical protein
MHNKFVYLVAIKTLLLFAITSVTAFSQIKIVSPTPRAVYQREASGQREVNISGTFDVPIDKVEVRAVAAIVGQGIDTPWQTLELNPKGGVFSGKITLYGGWYTVEVRASLAGNIVGRDVLERLGVGEIFIIAGQSNAQGLFTNPGPGATDDRVVYVSNYVNNSATKEDLLTDPPRAGFSQLSSGIPFIGPRGQTPWCWGILGDQLVKNLNVPVLFINVAWEGTAIENWAKSARGEDTWNYYSGGPPNGYKYQKHMPYANLRIAAKTYATQYGMRAILWMQGESDALYKTSSQEYRNNLQFIIDQLSTDAGRRITWVISRTSRTADDMSRHIPVLSPAVIAAQNAVIETPFNPVVAGPETDNIYPNRGDGTHFVGDAASGANGTLEALTLLANAWYKVLTPTFFATVPPISPSDVPPLTAACVPENDGVSISLPDGYSSYIWNNGQTGRTIKVTQAGRYFATVKDANGNSTITSEVVLASNAKPNPPTILPQGSQQACAEEGIVFSTLGRDQYSWYKEDATTPLVTGNSVTIKESGNYTVRAQNIFGCISDKSTPSSLLVRPKVPKPVIESSGPFSITATIETGGEDLREKYSWKRPGIEQDTITEFVKVLRTGVYTATAQVTYTLGSNVLTCYSDTTSKNFITIEQNDVVLFPNPSLDEYIYIESRDNIKDATVLVYDIFGRLLAKHSIPLISSRVPIRITNLASGKYVVRISAPGLDVTRHMVVR